MSKITWSTAAVPTVKLSEWLNEKEFQPGEFHLLADPSGPFQTIVIFVVKDDEAEEE